MLDSLSLVVPAYNEQTNLLPTVREAEAVLRPVVAIRQWVLVDDGSTDGTPAEIASLVESVPGAVTVRHERRRGLGAALWAGVGRATEEWVTWLPGDGQIKPHAIQEMSALAGPCDLIMLMREEARRDLDRRVITLGMYGLVRLLLGFDPYGFSGVFMARRSLLAGLPLKSSTGVQNYAVVMHGRRQGARVAQVRTVIQPRRSGRSKVANARTTLTVLADILKLRLTWGRR